MFVTKSIAQLADVNGQPEAVIGAAAADKPSSCSVSSIRRTVVRCRPLNSASRPGVAPPSNLQFNNNKPGLIRAPFCTLRTHRHA